MVLVRHATLSHRPREPSSQNEKEREHRDEEPFFYLQALERSVQKVMEGKQAEQAKKQAEEDLTLPAPAIFILLQVGIGGLLLELHPTISY